MNYFLLLHSAFFAVLFLQSGLDKVTDYKGNLDWLSGHFAKSPLGKNIRFFLLLLTLFELVSGFLQLSSFILLLSANSLLVEPAQLICGTTLLMLFAGQRLAKDYAGASTIAIYFGVFLLAYVLI